MARLVLLLLLVLAAALVIALWIDHRGRRDSRVDRLRQAFLHGRPLAGHERPVAVVEIVHPGGVRFHAPASWAIDLVEGERPDADARGTGPRRVQVEVLRLELRAGGSIAEALKAFEPERQHSVEALPSGAVLLKSLVPARVAGAPAVSYTWRLAHPGPAGQLRVAVFRLQLPVESASDVIAQSDLGSLERELREATFSADPSGGAV